MLSLKKKQNSKSMTGSTERNMILEIMMWGFFSAWGWFGASYIKDQVWPSDPPPIEKKIERKND
jgi:hypothetical protein